MKLVDCFIFYNELELLDYRLNILDSVIDYFVIVEATHTFVGKEKPLIYSENKHLFEKFAHKIIHIVVDDMPYKYPNIEFDKKQQWSNEHYQRNCIDRGIKQLGLNDEDVIFITDVDEILDPRKLQLIRNDTDVKTILQTQILSLEMEMYYYNLKMIVTYERWVFPKMISYQLYNKISNQKSCNDIRLMNARYISGMGWHLSYFGDIEFIKNKVKHFSHQEFNLDQYTTVENISKSIDTGSDLFKRQMFDLVKKPLHENSNLPYDYEKYLQKYM